ncbi:hypothetical protein B0H17DRAFT_1151636 [Mycena rosella]|uniref:Uncharacterized protein n=1 Tax=Mycena rosella TaxID=1033263 RepID=A0AAD7BJ88_MYCRO|nr:hypothetical protein B0H17DRAFT_1151636 [Mycena rosella]
MTEPQVSLHLVWKQGDMGKWSGELRKAYTVFELGEKWADTWGGLVERFMNFEAIADVGHWGKAGSYSNEWWLWWQLLQLPERKVVGGGLSRPTEMTFRRLTEMCGRNGFMQSGKVGAGWGNAVADVDYMLGVLLESEELKDKSVTNVHQQGPLPQKGKKRKRVEGPAEETNDNALQTKKAKRAKAVVEKHATCSTAVSDTRVKVKGILCMERTTVRVFGKESACTMGFCTQMKKKKEKAQVDRKKIDNGRIQTQANMVVQAFKVLSIPGPRR